MENKELTGYPSVDKPWMKYYESKAINQKLPAYSMFEYILQNNQGYYDNIALEYCGQTITYGEMFSKIEMVAASLASIGVKKDDIVSFIATTTPEIVFSIYAVNRLGAVCNMIDPRMPDETITNIISNTKSHYLIVLDNFSHKVSMMDNSEYCDIIVLPATKLESFDSKIQKAHISSQHIMWDELLSRVSFEENISILPFKANRPAIIEYTGGTTGEPKGVVLSNENVNAAAFQYLRTRINNERGQSWQTVAAPFIAYALIFSMHIPLSLGMVCKIVIYDPKTIAIQIVQKKYNHIAGNPLMWESVLRLPEAQSQDFSHLIAPITGADYLNPKLEAEINNFLKAHGCKWEICQAYGLTEVLPACINQGKDCTRYGSVGIPVIDTTISIFDSDTYDELKYGETGEICIAGPCNMLGYFNNKAETDKMIKKHKDGISWIHTGDSGHMDSDGFLYIDGRIKRMFVCYNGAKVFPSFIEKVVVQLEQVVGCVIVGKQDPAHSIGQVPVAFVILKENCNDNADDIISELEMLCKGKLPEYECPVEWHFVDSFPRTSVGKIDYRTLEQRI